MSTLRMSASGEPAPDLATPQFDQEEATDLLLEATNSAIALQKGKAGDSASLPSMSEADKTQSRNWLDVLADHGGVDDQKILRRGTLASLASMALFGNAGAALAAGRGGGGGRSGGRVGGRAPSRAAARPAPRAAPAPAPRTNVYVTPPRSTNVYVNPGFGGGYGYGGGFGYGGGVFGGGPGLGTYLGLSFAESLLRQQQRREMLDRELRTQQELGRDQGQIQALQQQLAAQDASIAALKAKGDTGTAPAQGQPAKSEQQQMLEMKELLLKQQQEIIDLKKDKK